MKEIFDLTIIGNGPASLTAAIYASRANLNVLIIGDGPIGGKLVNINTIENYPGFSSISGIELINHFKEQINKCNITIINDKVIKMQNNIITTINNNDYESKSILIATGSKPKKLDIPGSKKFEGKGISYCATCDGFFFKNKKIAVIGNNEQALEEALYLSNIVSKLYLINRNHELNIVSPQYNKILNNPKITLLNSTTLKDLIIKDEKIIGIKVFDLKKSEFYDIECEGIFPYIDNNPGTEFVDNRLLDKDGFINVDENMATKLDGIFAAGDCIKKNLRQIVTACSDGAIAATSIIKYLKSKN